MVNMLVGLSLGMMDRNDKYFDHKVEHISIKKYISYVDGFDLIVC